MEERRSVGGVPERVGKRRRPAPWGRPRSRSEPGSALADQAAVLDLVASEEVPASMEERFKVALNATTDTSREQARAERVSSGESLAEKMVSLFFPTRAVAAMAVAAALVVCIQAGIIFSMVDGVQNGNQYETASGEEEVTGISTRFLVKFTPDVEFASVEKLPSFVSGIEDIIGLIEAKRKGTV